MKKYLLLGTLIAIIPNYVFGESAEYRRLVNEKNQKIEELNKCTGDVNGWKIAGISTIGLTAVGVAGNVALANKQSSLDKEIARTDTKITNTRSDIDRQNAEIVARNQRRLDCQNSGGTWSSADNTCVATKTLETSVAQQSGQVVPVASGTEPSVPVAPAVSGTESPVQPVYVPGLPAQAGTETPAAEQSGQTTPAVSGTEQPEQTTPGGQNSGDSGDEKTVTPKIQVCSFSGMTYSVNQSLPGTSCTNVPTNKDHLTGGTECNCKCGADGQWNCRVTKCDDRIYRLVPGRFPDFVSRCEEKTVTSKFQGCSYAGTTVAENQSLPGTSCTNVPANKDRLIGGTECDCKCIADGQWNCQVTKCDDRNYRLVSGRFPDFVSRCEEKTPVTSGTQQSGQAASGAQNPNNTVRSPSQQRVLNNGVASGFGNPDINAADAGKCRINGVVYNGKNWRGSCDVISSSVLQNRELLANGDQCNCDCGDHEMWQCKPTSCKGGDYKLEGGKCAKQEKTPVTSGTQQSGQAASGAQNPNNTVRSPSQQGVLNNGVASWFDNSNINTADAGKCRINGVVYNGKNWRGSCDVISSSVLQNRELLANGDQCNCDCGDHEMWQCKPTSCKGGDYKLEGDKCAKQEKPVTTNNGTTSNYGSNNSYRSPSQQMMLDKGIASWY